VRIHAPASWRLLDDQNDQSGTRLHFQMMCETRIRCIRLKRYAVSTFWLNGFAAMVDSRNTFTHANPDRQTFVDELKRW